MKVALLCYFIFSLSNSYKDTKYETIDWLLLLSMYIFCCKSTYLVSKAYENMFPILEVGEPTPGAPTHKKRSAIFFGHIW